MKIEKSLFDLRSEDVDRWLSTSDCYGTVLAMHTYDEFWCSTYFTELKSHIGNDDFQQIVQLWKLYITRQLIDEGAVGPDPNSRLKGLKAEYDYFVERFEPKEFKSEHADRIHEILSHTEQVIRDKSGNFVKLMGEPGIYSNGKRTSLDKIKYIKTKLLPLNQGFVLDDEWNEFMIFVKKGNSIFLFEWETGA